MNMCKLKCHECHIKKNKTITTKNRTFPSKTYLDLWSVHGWKWHQNLNTSPNFIFNLLNFHYLCYMLSAPSLFLLLKILKCYTKNVSKMRNFIEEGKVYTHTRTYPHKHTHKRVSLNQKIKAQDGPGLNLI